MFVVSHCLQIGLRPPPNILHEALSCNNEARLQALGLPGQPTKVCLVHIVVMTTKFAYVMSGLKVMCDFK